MANKGPKQRQIEWLQERLSSYQSSLTEERAKTIKLESENRAMQSTLWSYQSRSSRAAIVAALELVQHDQVQILGGTSDFNSYGTPSSIGASPVKVDGIDPLWRDDYPVTQAGRAMKLNEVVQVLLSALRRLEEVK